MNTTRIYFRRSQEFEQRLEGQYQGQSEEEITGSVVEFGEGDDIDRGFDADSEVRIKYDIDELDSLFLNRIPDQILDLVELAVAVMGVDRFVERTVVAGEEVADSDARLDTRSIALTFPVLSPSFATSDVEDLISTLVSHMTRDIFEFELYEHPSSEEKTTQETFGEPESVDVVSLFSEGLDSAGGVYQNRNEGIKAEYLSLRYGSGLGEVHETMASELDVDPTRISVEYDDTTNEYTNFSRGFLHWAFATGVAAAKGAKEIRSFETGIMARFALLGEAWQTTRTVSPTAVELFNELLGKAIDYEMQLVNPFRQETKTEVIERIENESAVRKAVSCPHYGQQRGFDLHNCGQCVPCIIRNVAILQSSFSIPPAELSICNWAKVDFEADELPAERPGILDGRNDADTFFLALHEIAYLCRLLRQGEPSEVVTEYPKLASSESYQLYRRFADEFHDCFESLSEENPTASVLLGPE